MSRNTFTENKGGRLFPTSELRTYDIVQVYYKAWWKCTLLALPVVSSVWKQSFTKPLSNQMRLSSGLFAAGKTDLDGYVWFKKSKEQKGCKLTNSPWLNTITTVAGNGKNDLEIKNETSVHPISDESELKWWVAPTIRRFLSFLWLQCELFSVAVVHCLLKTTLKTQLEKTGI